MNPAPWAVGDTKCESCGKRRPLVVVCDGSSIFHVCSSCASDAVDHGWTLEVGA